MGIDKDMIEMIQEHDQKCKQLEDLWEKCRLEIVQKDIVINTKVELIKELNQNVEALNQTCLA